MKCRVDYRIDQNKILSLSYEDGYRNYGSG